MNTNVMKLPEEPLVLMFSVSSPVNSINSLIDELNVMNVLTSLLPSPPDGKVLPGDLTHYVVPDVGVVVDYLEIFLEFRELQGVVFTQTACQAVQQSKGRR